METWEKKKTKGGRKRLENVLQNLPCRLHALWGGMQKGGSVLKERETTNQGRGANGEGGAQSNLIKAMETMRTRRESAEKKKKNQ